MVVAEEYYVSRNVLRSVFYLLLVSRARNIFWSRQVPTDLRGAAPYSWTSECNINTVIVIVVL